MPLVTTVHNAFERSAVLMAVGDRVLAVSRAVEDGMAARGVPRAKLRTVLNGTVGSARAPVPPPPPEALVAPSIVFVGGMHPRKGVHDLITAMTAVHAEVPQAALHLVGEGPFEAEYRAQASGMPYVHFHGARRDPRGFLAAASIFVLASHADPAPLVISEACAAGCAVVASAVDGIPEMLDGGRAGVLTPPRDPQALAAALLRLLRSPEELAAARAAALANADRLTIGRVAREVLDNYPNVRNSRTRRVDLP